MKVVAAYLHRVADMSDRSADYHESLGDTVLAETCRAAARECRDAIKKLEAK